jgi:hypothetical protein
VTTSSPTDLATGVPAADISINFSEAVNVTASAFTLGCLVGTPIAFALSPAPATEAQAEAHLETQNPDTESGTYGTGAAASLSGSNYMSCSSAPNEATWTESFGRLWLGAGRAARAARGAVELVKLKLTQYWRPSISPGSITRTVLRLRRILGPRVLPCRPPPLLRAARGGVRADGARRRGERLARSDVSPLGAVDRAVRVPKSPPSAHPDPSNPVTTSRAIARTLSAD